MTTIATDGRTLACDSRIHSGGAADPSPYNKTRVTEQRIYAYAGDSALFGPLIQWYEAGANSRQLPALPSGGKAEACLWIFENGKLFEIEWNVPYKMELNVPNATGSGHRWAMGALLAGASPERAIGIATQCDLYSGGPVQVIELPPHLQVISATRAAKIRGGKRRAESLSPERRSEIAQEAAKQRWSKESADH